jgi:hypothetical protein
MDSFLSLLAFASLIAAQFLSVVFVANQHRKTTGNKRIVAGRAAERMPS